MMKTKVIAHAGVGLGLARRRSLRGLIPKGGRCEDRLVEMRARLCQRKRRSSCERLCAILGRRPAARLGCRFYSFASWPGVRSLLFRDLCRASAFLRWKG